MQNVYRKNSTYQGAWGTICGLHPSKLPRELLQEIDVEKLLECLKEDYRVEHIVAEKLQTIPFKNLTIVKRIIDNGIKDFPKIVEIYNQRLDKDIAELDKKSTYWYRGDYIFIDILDEKNKIREIKNWLEGKESVISGSNVDYEFILTHFKDLAENKIKQIMGNASVHYYSQGDLRRMIETLPENKIPEIFPEIMKRKSSVYINVLSNPKTPKSFTVKALRAAANKSYLPAIKVKIDEEILKELPTITRLDVVESLLNNAVCTDFINNFSSSQEMANLLFSSTIRYPDRVEKVVREIEAQIDKTKNKEL